MKISFYLTAFCIISLSIFLVWSKLDFNHHNISISVSEDENIYEFIASYNKAATGNIQQYINRYTSTVEFGDHNKNYFDMTNQLPDNTRFQLKGSPGYIKILLDKKANTVSSYYRIKKMCDGIKDIIGGKQPQ